MNPIIRGELIVKDASINQDACVFMSFGKDSLVALDLVVKHGNFSTIYLCYLCLAKGLSHVKPYVERIKKRYPDQNLIYIEEFHFDYYVYKKDGVFCDPADTRYYRVLDIEKAINVKYSTNCSFFLGWKMSDSPARALTLNTYQNQGSFLKANRFFPVSRFTHNSILKYIQMYKLPAPIAYGKKNGKMNGFGLNGEMYKWLKTNHPQDLRLLQKEFPYFIF